MNLRIVVLEFPYETLTDKPLARDLFGKMAQMKIEGYCNMHGYGVLPLDTTDFIGTHLLVCDESKTGELTPLMGYKSTNYSVCKKFGIDFPIIKFAQKSNNTVCAQALEKLLKDCSIKNEEISYDTSWTILPEMRENKELQKTLKELTGAILVHHHLDYQIPYWLTFGICKFKTDQYFIELGAKDVSEQPMIKHSGLHNTDAKMVCCATKDYTLLAKQLAKKHEELWKNRLTLSPSKKRHKEAA